MFEHAPEHLGEVGHVDRGPVLPSGAEHDQVAGLVARRAEEQSGDSAAAVTVGRTGHHHDATHVSDVEQPGLYREFPGHERGWVERRALVDGAGGAVDPQTADVDVRLAGAREGAITASTTVESRSALVAVRPSWHQTSDRRRRRWG